MNHSTPDEGWEKEFVEKGANLEHSRWAKWQNYLHSFLAWNDEIKAWVLPHEKKEHWDSQIRTPYSYLSEHEKEMDRKETREYLPLIRTHFIPKSTLSRVIEGKRKENVFNNLLNTPEGELIIAKRDGYNEALDNLKAELGLNTNKDENPH